MSNNPQTSSYGQILKSSSIVGGAQGINYIIGMVRTKLVAVLLGPSGIGLVGLYMSATDLVATIAGLGISSSGVREVAEAHGGGDAEQVARTVKTLRRVCWVTGIFGWLLCAAFSYPLSFLTFGSGEAAWSLAALGVTILIGSVSGGQNALIQGTRRIGDLARIGVLGAVVSTIVAVVLYAWLGKNGVIPVIIVTAAANLGFSWWFARQIQVAPISLTWAETLGNSKRLIQIGIAFMYGSLLASLVGLTIRTMIVKKYGLDANGIYQATWAISGMFASFIINAMGTDFYPRLTAVAKDNEQINRLVNEQIEIGILLALPGLLGSLSFAPWVMRLLYSTKFIAGAELLPWFLIGVFGSIILFPLGFIQRAKGAIRWIYIGQSWANISYLVLASVFIPSVGILGAAYAYTISVTLHSLVIYLIARHLSKFVWTPETLKLIAASFSLIFAGLATKELPGDVLPLCLGVALVGYTCVFSLRGITSRIGSNHRVIRVLCNLPGGHVLCGLK